MKVEIKFKAFSDKVHTDIIEWDEKGFTPEELRKWTGDDWEEFLYETELDMVSYEILSEEEPNEQEG